MIDYRTHTLANGLTVVANRDGASQLAAVNILYRVGSRNENPARTGFAHLFEHLMFRGTRRIPDFDTPVQQASGENNAFTNNDYTDYYITLPVANIETAFWLESDRMRGLDINSRALEAEKKVVVEEYNQRYRNQPYGDQWMLLREMAYKVHPYRWATIGLSIDHIKGAKLQEVRDFYRRYYTPSNAILSVSADMPEEKVFEMAGRWFGPVEDSAADAAPLPAEPPQTAPRRVEVTRAVPADAITIAFHMGGRTSRQFYQFDVISDLLAGGTSGRLYRSLVKERRMFSAVNAYMSGDVDPGLMIVTGHLAPGVDTAAGERALWDELEKLQNEAPGDHELEKVRNKFEANTTYGELNVMNKAMNLGFYSMLGDMSLLNGEVALFRSIGAREIMDAARAVFTSENSNTLIYHAEKQ